MAVQRKIVEIDETKCDGCGLCVPSCAEGAIQIIDGKARLVSDVYCDGLGACLGHCPRGAISVTERTAEPFDEKAVEQRLAALRSAGSEEAGQPGGHASCPGSAVRDFGLNVLPAVSPEASQHEPPEPETPDGATPTALRQWPVQLQLVPPSAPFLQGANLLLVADCVPVAYADFHARFLRDRPVVLACPKLDDTRPYVDKLAAMVVQAAVASVTVVQMEVPCCGGLYRLVEAALEAAGRRIPLERVVISIQGRIAARSSSDR